MNDMEALMTGILSSGDKPEIRVRRNRDGRFSVRIYAHNQKKTAHGVGDSVQEALMAATLDRPSS